MMQSVGRPVSRTRNFSVIAPADSGDGRYAGTQVVEDLPMPLATPRPRPRLGPGLGDGGRWLGCHASLLPRETTRSTSRPQGPPATRGRSRHEFADPERPG